MKKYFFIGICGISMSALAVLIKKEGNEVCGCDRNHKNIPKILKDDGIKVFPEKKFDELKNCDIIVVSSAIKEDNAALVYAKKIKKTCKSRGEILGEIASGYEKVIAVAGSHGKTTTTAMIFQILTIAGKNPTLHLGGNLIDKKTNVVEGGREYFVTEACEYYDNFLNLFPYISVVTNIEKEHLDYFKTFENEKKSFEKFKMQSKFVVLKTIYEAKNVCLNKNGGVSFDVFEKEKYLVHICLKIGGFFNIKNALFAFEVCKMLCFTNELIRIGLENFLGTQKRLERKEFLGKEIIVDYAHHPTEIKNAFEFLNKLGKKIRVVFQPHTFSRTKEFEKDFVNVLSKFDEVYLFKTYPAREKPKDGLSALKLSKKIQNSRYLSCKNEVEKLILSQRTNEITVLMGAGDLPEKLGIY